MDNNKEKKPFVLIRPITHFLNLDTDEKGSFFLWLSLILFIISATFVVYIKFGMIPMSLLLSAFSFCIGLLLKLFSI